MLTQGEQRRELILKTMNANQTGNALVSTSYVAEHTGIDIEEVKDHFAILDNEGHIKATWTASGNGFAYLLGAGIKVAREGYKSLTPTQINIGALVNGMTGGSVQGIGKAEQSEIRQIANDPEVLSNAINQIATNILESFHEVLAQKQLARLEDMLGEVQEELAEGTKESFARKIMTMIGYISDAGGAYVTLSTLAQYLPLLFALAAAKFG